MGRNKGRGWTNSGVVAEFYELPKGDSSSARPTRARRGDRGRPGVVAYWSRRMAYVHDTGCVSRFEQRGLWCHRLQLVWPSCGQQNLGRRNALPQVGSIGQSVSGASVRQQLPIGLASLVQVSLAPPSSPSTKAKFADAQGEPCRKQTVGLLQRRHVRIGLLTNIGKESNSLEEVQAGLVHDEENVYTTYDDPSRGYWQTVILPAVRQAPLAMLVNACAGKLSRRALIDIRAGRSAPHRKNQGSARGCRAES